MPYTGSKAFSGQGSVLAIGNGGSPEAYVEIMELKTINPSGTKADLVDVTNMDSGVYREKLPTLIDSGEISFAGNYVPSDEGQGLARAAFLGRQKLPYMITEPLASLQPGETEPGYASFMGYVTELNGPDLDYSKEATITGKVTITGEKFYTPAQ